jgi:hypothetical protein
MELSNYSVADFVLNESFQKWILESDDEAKVFWEDWLTVHPDKAEVISEARITIQSIRDAYETKPIREYGEVWNRITASIHVLESDEIMKKIKEIENMR